MEVVLSLHQSLATSDDGGSSGTYVINDEEMLAGEGELGGG